MSLQHGKQLQSSTNGFSRRVTGKEGGALKESRLPSGRLYSSMLSQSSSDVEAKGLYENSPRDRLIYVATCLIGHHVEVHVKNGSILSGIFHATNTEDDFGVVLKMARMIKEGAIRGQNNFFDVARRPQTMIIPARELVQVIAKDVQLSGKSSSNGYMHEMNQDFMIDSAISHPHHAEERKLEPWKPETDNPHCPDLENIFDSSRHRKWDQFETNKALFGVKSTFDEELYTTKLEKGPQTRELEIEALRIAREIEGEVTNDLHLAEERGLHLHGHFDLDEESRFSAVFRGNHDDVYEENEIDFLDSQNSETFGVSSDSPATNASIESCQKKVSNVGQASTSGLDMDEEVPSQVYAKSQHNSAHFMRPHSESVPKHVAGSVDRDSRVDKQLRGLGGGRKVSDENDNTGFADFRTGKSEGRQSSVHAKKSSFDKGNLSTGLQEHKNLVSGPSEPESSTSVPGVVPVNSNPRPGSSASSSDRAAGGSVASTPGLSPSSSMGSFTSEKSKLNPHAKEFKLNPNAKSFTPLSSVRQHPPPISSEGSIYYGSSVPHMHGVPVGMMGTSFSGQQPVVYNPHALQMQPPQAYAHPGGPLYGQQQMVPGQPRPVMYMPTYPPEMLYKGRDF